jgi:hypothetical protein
MRADPVAVAHEERQDVEHLRLDPLDDTITAQLVPVGIEHAFAEDEPHASSYRDQCFGQPGRDGRG